MDQLQGVDYLFVRQKKEWGEILTGFETKNRYVAEDRAGQALFYIAETKSSFFLRVFLRGLRPFEMTIVDAKQQSVLFLKRPFHFFFSRMLIMDANHQLLGMIQQKFSLLKRVYIVYDFSGDESFRIIGPLLHPWTFHIEKNFERVGKVVKRWSGLLKESMTDADHFSVDFPTRFDSNEKSLVLGSVFLIDFVHFESNKN